MLDPAALGETSPAEKYDDFLRNGVEVKPLNYGKLKGISFEVGGGFKVVGENDGEYLQYHPERGSHHKEAYYKLSSGKTGKKRYGLDGKGIDGE